MWQLLSTIKPKIFHEISFTTQQLSGTKTVLWLGGSHLQIQTQIEIEQPKIQALGETHSLGAVQ